MTVLAITTGALVAAGDTAAADAVAVAASTEPRAPITSAPRAPSLAPRVPRAKAVARRPFSEYREEYSYVRRDLRRVAVVAAALLAMLILLSFALR